jgi:hypothetical protein
MTIARRLHSVVVSALLLTTGCHIGPTAKRHAPATRATGATTTVSTPTRNISGELLELRDTALVVLGEQVTLIPIRVIDRAVFSDTRVTIDRRYVLRPTEREELRLLGRFPYGIPQAALSKLLASKGQTSILVVDR